MKRPQTIALRGLPDAGRATLVLLALMALTAVAYWPSLHGGYLFDDSVYFVDNPDVHVKSLQLGEWVRAALAQSGINPLLRPLGSLSFALNYYLTGVDPFWPKLTNLFIHLLNGGLLFLALRAVFALSGRVRGERPAPPMAAALIAGIWLLLPINLSGVAYVSQRMEELATTFVFIGLTWYSKARREHYEGTRSGHGLWLILVVCTAAGLTAKEDAALLPAFTACLELSITGFRDRSGRFSRASLWTHFGVLVVPMLAGLALVIPRLLGGVATTRTFTMTQRLLTEPRVLVDYIHWTLLPNLSSLTFYHDDLKLSDGLLQPPSTLLAILALLALLAIALWQRKARPLFCLGILWFFAGHSMTATIIPLELVFEHRNYFPSVGLLLSAASLLALEPGLPFPIVRTLATAAFIVFAGFTTFLRAEEWSHPLRFAYSEALKRPDSPRAQYELARTLIVAAGDGVDTPLVNQATELLERTADLPDSGIGPWQALIYINGKAKRPIDPHWWQAMIARLKAQPPSKADVSAVIFLYRCQMDGRCALQPKEMFETFVAALTTSGGNVNLMSAYAEFALKVLRDRQLAEQLAREVVAVAPAEPIYRANLVRFLIESGKYDAAETEITELAKLSQLGSLDALVATLKNRLAEARAAAPSPPGDHSTPPDKATR